ncbi:MAG: ThuA domain-containing protein [Devosia sp.]|nr:ThuA domain-containing protein [Devosia sp.]
MTIENRKALIVWGGWPGHEPEVGARLVESMLEQDGFAVTVTNDYGAMGGSDIEDFRLVVPIVTNDEIERDIVLRLIDAVRSGVGLAGYHGALTTSFRRSVEWHFLCGVQRVGHPGNIIDFHVDVTKPDDPVMQGLSGFDYHSEQYYLHYDPSVDILATTTFSGKHDPVTAGVTMPVAFKRQFGAGRIFYTALGHVAAEFEHPQMRAILRRSLNWAAR